MGDHIEEPRCFTAEQRAFCSPALCAAHRHHPAASSRGSEARGVSNRWSTSRVTHSFPLIPDQDRNDDVGFQ
jgi:hypothetical protein